MTNSQKWLLVLALQFLSGVCQAAGDKGASVGDWIRRGFEQLPVTITALLITLQKGDDNSTKPKPE